MQIEQSLDLLTAKSIREQMDKHGLVRHKHRKTLIEILGLSESQAHRKLAGQAGWTLHEIKKVADYFGVCPNVILSSIFTDTANEALIEINQQEYPCLVWIGPALTEPGEHPLIAFQQDHTWRVSSADKQTNAKIFAVDRIEFGRSPKLSVAILDDDISFVESIALQLGKFGFHASSYHDEEVFLNEIAHKEFDAFVIDWLLEKHTADKLISNMRRSKTHKHTPIILLTGNTDHYAADIANVIQEHRAIFLGKPVSSAIIAAQLKTILNIN
jgi:ActR/RegA family two-component response regulator